VRWKHCRRILAAVQMQLDCAAGTGAVIPQLGLKKARSQVQCFAARSSRSVCRFFVQQGEQSTGVAVLGLLDAACRMPRHVYSTVPGARGDSLQQQRQALAASAAATVCWYGLVGLCWGGL
jgi:hypothetical protein